MKEAVGASIAGGRGASLGDIVPISNDECIMQQSVDAHMSRLSMAFRRGGGHEGACRELQPVDRPPIASLCMTLLQCSPASSTRDTTVPNWRYRWSCAPRPAPARSPPPPKLQVGPGTEPAVKASKPILVEDVPCRARESAIQLASIRAGV